MKGLYLTGIGVCNYTELWGIHYYKLEKCCTGNDSLKVTSRRYKFTMITNGIMRCYASVQ